MFFRSLAPIMSGNFSYRALRSADFAYPAWLIGGTLNPKIRLYSGNINLAENTPLATLMGAECNFTGYAPQPITSLTDTVGWDGPTLMRLALGSFFELNLPPTVTQVANGYFITTETASVPDMWWVAEQFPNPIPFAMSGDFLSLTVALAISFAAVPIPA